MSVAEYALRDINKPLGIAEFRTQDLLPDTLKGALPTIEELEAELAASPPGWDGISLKEATHEAE